jgi:mono/diheme cytochrome c family protein
MSHGWSLLRKALGGLIVAGLLLAGCGDPPASGIASDPAGTGADLYQQYCAECHRADLSGDPDWKSPNDDGSYPPPPHDSSGHTWHHPDRVLVEIVRDGSDLPESRMPAFGDRLSDTDITTILEFIKSSWGEQERAYQEQVTRQDQGQ